MRRTLVTLALGLVLAAAQGCASMGVGNPFSNDPLTGGADAASSQLLNVPLPTGMQRYASHGYMNYGADGEREGLETLRGNVDASQAAQSMFTALQSQGWQLRLSLRKGDRSLYVYDKGNSLAAVRRPGQKVLGFAAETAPDMDALLPLARAKLARKKADLLAANRVNAVDSGFGTPTNSMAVADARGREEIWPSQSKADVAWELCTWLLRI